ncbi:MAG: hypothetical protein QM723_21615 [Myxococcaceae bacterium]
MERALERALADWRLLPSEELADVVDELSDALTSQRPPLSPPRCFAAAQTRDPLALGQVLASLPPVTDPSLRDRLGLLYRWPRDPRVATAIVRLLCQALPPARATSLWSVLLGLLAWSGDRRAAQWLRDFSTVLDGTPWQVMRVGVRLNQLAEDLERARPQSRGPLRVRRERYALPVLKPAAAVPQGLEAKLVWADKLSSEGDVRGEAIVLGLMPAPRRQQRRRSKELVRLYGRAWLGRLSPAFKPEGLRFRDGAVVAGRLSVSRLLYRLTGLPEWATVEELDLRETARWPRPEWEALAKVISDPMLLGLRRLHGVPVSLLGALLKQHRALGVEHLELLDVWHNRLLWLRDLARSKVFPKLRTVHVYNELHQIEPFRNTVA